MSILLQFLFALGLVVVMLSLGYWLGPKRKTQKKGNVFECGISSEGSARVPFRVGYFLVAILFVLFDVEIVFMYPWAVNFRELIKEFGMLAFTEMLIFSLTIFLGLGYVIRRGAFKWAK